MKRVRRFLRITVTKGLLAQKGARRFGFLNFSSARFLPVGESTWRLSCRVGLICLLVAATLLAAGCAGRYENLAAVVNGQEITRQEFDAQVVLFTKPVTGELVEPKNKLLESLVNQELVLAEAQKNGLAVSPKEIDKRVRALKKGKSNLYKTIQRRQGIQQYKENLRSWALFEQMRKRVVKRIAVSDREVANFYRQNYEQFRPLKLAEVKRDIYDELLLDRQDKAFKAWVMKLRSNSDIWRNAKLLD